MDDKTTYKANVYCKNCDFRQEIEIPKGQKIEEATCPSCGNLELVKNYNPETQTQSYYNFD